MGFHVHLKKISDKETVASFSWSFLCFKKQYKT